MLENLRRRIALVICPEIKLLPYQAPREKARRKPRSAAEAHKADALRRLDRMYATYSGVVLDRRSAPVYTGPLYEWQITAWLVRERVISALARLRDNPEVGVLVNTYFMALNYFDAIWPADLEWPRDIPRPDPRKKKEVA